jgi:Ca2+-binding EF-hand superfamily protein
MKIFREETDGKKNQFGELVTLFRMLRILRILRMVRMFRSIPQLGQLASGLMESLKTSLSIFVLFVFIIAVFAIGITRYVRDDQDPEVQVYFGSWVKSCCTLFQFVTLDDWSRISRRASRLDCRNPVGIIEQCEGEPRVWLMFVFVLYVVVTAFSILSLLTGVISEHMIQLSKFNDKQAEELEDREKLDFMIRFHKMFVKADVDGSNTISREELRDVLAIPDVQDELYRLKGEGFEIPNFGEAGPSGMNGFEELFEAIVPQGDDEVTFEEFSQGFLRMRGSAKGIHLLELQAELRRLRNDFGLNGPEATMLGSLHQKLNGIMQVLSDVTVTLARLEHRVKNISRQHGSTPSSSRGHQLSKEESVREG